jgi:hypothetical protein
MPGPVLPSGWYYRFAEIGNQIVRQHIRRFLLKSYELVTRPVNTEGAFTGIKVDNKDLFWHFRITSCLRWITDSYRRASSEAPKETHGKKDFSAGLIFHKALTKDLSPSADY